MAVGVLSFLGRGRDRVEAVEGKEDDRRRRHHAALDAVGSHMLGKAIGAERFEIGGVEGGQCDRDEDDQRGDLDRSEEHTSELQSLMRNSYDVFCLKKKNNKKQRTETR